MNITKTIASGLVLTALALPVWAGGWQLEADESRIAFTSIKKNTAGEVNHFEAMSGAVSEDGMAEIRIDLTSVESWVDIRNERIRTHLFRDTAEAVLTAQLDMDELARLAPGESMIADVSANLDLAGTRSKYDAELYVLRVAEDRVLVVSNDMIMLGTEAAGVDEGVTMLRNLADLSSITRVAPVTLRLMFVGG